MQMDLRLPIARAAAALTVAAALSGCNTVSTGMGDGQLITRGKPQSPVLFSWTSRDGGITGDLVATIDDAGYRGLFLQITNETTRESIQPMWNGWYGGWGRWREPWIGDVDATTFSRSYTGRVVANLTGPSGQSMRCRFDLMRPSTGMAGGGQGECQLSTGQRIDATIQPKG